MGSLAFIILLSGIIAAHAGVIDKELSNVKDTISQVRDKLHDIAAEGTEAASAFTGRVRKVVENVNGKIDKRLKDLNDTLTSKIEDAVSSLADGAPDSVPKCLLDKEKEIADFIASNLVNLGECVTSPITSITKSIQKLVVAADVAAKAANDYTDKIDKCKHKKKQISCLFKILPKATSSVKDLGVTITTEVANIGTTIATIEADIPACISKKLFSPS